MLNKRIIPKILNIKNIIIDEVNFNENTSSVLIDAHVPKSHRNICPFCGKKASAYDQGNGKRLWRACDWNNKKVFIRANAPRICCEEHGVVVAMVPWAGHDSWFTCEFEQLVVAKVLNCSKTAVSREMRINWRTVGEIVSRVRDRVDTEPEKRCKNLVSIGIDETSYRKGHKYATVVVNHKSGKVVWVSLGYGKQILSKFFNQIKEDVNSIKYVSADGAKWIASTLSEYVPEAIRCMDGFHVVQWATELLDEVRKEAWRDARRKVSEKPKRRVGRPSKTDAPKDNSVELIKGMKFALGKAPENLTESQRARLDMIADCDSRLFRAYKWKERLRLVFKLNYEEAEEELTKWIKGVKHSRIKSFVEFSEKIQRHKEAILATIRYGISNAQIESINNKIKLIIRMAYGFRNMENMLDMIMLKCSDIVIPYPWERLV